MSVETLADLARLLRHLRRREARARSGAELTYRELATRTGWSVAMVGGYLAGSALPPTDRFDVLIRLLGASPTEQGALATARDRVADGRRGTADPAGVPAAPPVPHELPAPPHFLIGRAEQVALLDAAVQAGGPVCALSGIGGVGKTALALHWTHKIQDRFPDGQLYINLRGYDPGEPLAPADALGRFLRSLGLDATQIGEDEAERAARYRTLLAGRRMLVVLDNARSSDQVRPLLPGSGSCLVVVTSRDDLAGLVAVDGARRIDVDVLSHEHATDLLRELIGERVDEDPAAAAALARLCGRLPLALRVGAEQAVARPDDSLTDLVRDLSDESRRMDAFDAGEPSASVRAIFSWSYRHLPVDAARAFMLLGLHAGTDVDAYGLAALADVPVAWSRRLLRTLAQARLVSRTHGSRYAMHDLVRAYAAELADAALDDADHALARLFDYYRHGAAVAMDTLFPKRPGRPDLEPARVVVPVLDTPAPAWAWLDAERDNLVASAAKAATLGWSRFCTDLSQLLWPYLDDGHAGQALTVHLHAVAASGPDEPGHAAALTALGVTYWRLGRAAEAHDSLERALAAHARHRDATTNGWILTTHAALGLVDDSVGRYGESLEHSRRGLELARLTGDVDGEAVHLNNTGYALIRLERFAEATNAFTRAVRLSGAENDPRVEAEGRTGLGEALAGLDRHREALVQLVQALAAHREHLDRRAEALTLEVLGRVHRRLGHHAEAASHLDDALAIARGLGDCRLEARVLNSLAGKPRPCVESDASRIQHQSALRIATELGDRLEQARALDGLGDLCQPDHPTDAVRYWRAAEEIYAVLELPAAARVRAKLNRYLSRSATTHGLVLARRNGVGIHDGGPPAGRPVGGSALHSGDTVHSAGTVHSG